MARNDDDTSSYTSSVQNIISKFPSSAISLTWRLCNILPAAWAFQDDFLRMYHPSSCIDHPAQGAYPSCSSRMLRTTCAHRTCCPPISYHWRCYPKACAFITTYSSIRCIDGTIAEFLQGVEIGRSWHGRGDIIIDWQRSISGVRAGGNFQKAAEFVMWWCFHIRKVGAAGMDGFQVLNVSYIFGSLLSHNVERLPA